MSVRPKPIAGQRERGMNAEKPDSSDPAAPGPLFSGRFAGPEAFQKMVRAAFDHAAAEGWREIVLSDASFGDWPLRERPVVDALHAWARSGRKMIMLATTYDEVIRSHARFVTWRKTWGHLIDCRVCHGVEPSDFPSAIWSRDWFMQRQDCVRSTGACGSDRERSLQLRQALDEKIRVSTPGFPASTLGL